MHDIGAACTQYGAQTAHTLGLRATLSPRVACIPKNASCRYIGGGPSCWLINPFSKPGQLLSAHALQQHRHTVLHATSCGVLTGNFLLHVHVTVLPT